MKQFEQKSIIWLTLLLLSLFVGVGGLAAYAIVNWSGGTVLGAPIRWEQVAPPTVIHSNWTSFTHAGQVNDVAVRDNLLWAATDGGVVAWELAGDGVVKYTTEHGLAANRVRALAFAPDGVLWVATTNGIGRFDGQSWQAFREADGLASDDVRAIGVSREGNVWVGTANGVSRYNGRSWRTFQAGQFLSGLESNNVSSLVVADNGRLWVGTDAGVAVFNGRFWQNYTLADGLNSNTILKLAVAPNGHVWAATDAGLNRFDGDRWDSFASGFGLPSSPISALEATPDGSVWLASGTVLVRFDGNTASSTQGATSDINGLWREGGTLWTGTDAGVAEFDGIHWQQWEPPSDLPSAQVNGLAQTAEGVWVAMDVGIGRFDGSGWTTYDSRDGLIDNHAAALARSSGGTLWAAFPHAALGLARFDGQSWQALPCGVVGSPSRNIRASLEMADGTRWFGSDIGVARFDRAGWTTFTTFDGLPSNQVLDLAMQGEAVLAATTGGLAQFASGMWEPLNDVSITQARATSDAIWLLLENGKLARWSAGELFMEPLPFTATIRQIETTSDSVWLATTVGAAQFDGGWQLYTTDDGLAANDVLALATDAEGRIWAGGTGNSQALFFNWFDGEQWHEHPNRDPQNEVLHGNLVQTILPAPDGSVWLGGARAGIQRVSEEGWQSYEAEDVLSLLADVFDMTFATGNLWALTRNGLIYFDGEEWISFAAGHTGNPNSPQLLATDREGNLWVAPANFAEGMRRFDGLGWEILPTWRDRSRLSAFEFGPDGRLWVAGSLNVNNQGFLGVFDGTNWAWHFLPVGQPLSMAVASADAAWVGLDSGGGVVRLQLGDNGVFQEIDHFAEVAFPEEMLWVRDSRRLLVGSGDRIYELAEGVWHEFEVPIPFVRHIFALAEDVNGRLWVGTEWGTAVFDGETWQSFYAPPSSPTSWGAITTMSVREDNGITFGTTRGGIGLFTGRGYTGDRNPEWGQTEYPITTLLNDRERNLWVGTEGGGLARLDNGGWQSFSGADGLSAPVQSLGIATDGIAWLGTTSGLVSITDLTEPVCRFDTIEEEISGLSALRDQTGAVWFGTAAHGALQQPLGAQLGDGLWEGAPVPILAEAPDGVLWFVQARHDWLTRLGNGRSSRVPYDQTVLTAGEVTSLGVAPDLVVWVGTRDGLARFDGQRWEKLRTAVGLADNEITHLLIESDGTLWLATKGGVSRFAKK
ncbi:MAG: two-component regulator propeller domain-containing protein [Chloroflexota bacterium]